MQLLEWSYGSCQGKGKGVNSIGVGLQPIFYLWLDLEDRNHALCKLTDSKQEFGRKWGTSKMPKIYHMVDGFHEYHMMNHGSLAMDARRVLKI